ncbi:hypothetical protein L6452_42352 [Arctium lappa]|uniref:Uncharacterized protein n=1 Tax=Arctium lappa TaxID=4217 RepID=A0ACB8XIE2_ARCLA|nr:hypothetical protein L6452_42352 [Arctium lappa]
MDQVKDAARKLYYSTYKKNFKYEHAWAIVKDEPKWRGGSTNDVHTKRTKTDSSGSFTSSSDVQTSFKEEDDETRISLCRRGLTHMISLRLSFIHLPKRRFLSPPIFHPHR